MCNFKVHFDFIKNVDIGVWIYIEQKTIYVSSKFVNNQVYDTWCFKGNIIV